MPTPTPTPPRRPLTFWTRLTETAARLRASTRVRDLDQDFDQELASHVAMATDEHIRRGLGPEEARRKARLEVGGLAQLREAHRETRGLPLLETFTQDLRYTFRTLRRDAGFTLFALLIVGLGIGASTTVFSVVNALLFRPLPFHEPERLAWMANFSNDGEEGTLQVGHFLDLRDRNGAFTDFAAFYAFYGDGDSKLTNHGEPERVSAVPVSRNFFPLLGVSPVLGRTFTEEECNGRWNQPKAVLLSHRLWTRRFAADPRVIGQSLTLNEAAVTVAGVLPESFDFGSVFAPGRRIDLFLPLPLTEQVHRRGNTLLTVGRLKPGVTIERAAAEMDVLGTAILKEHPERNNLDPVIASLSDRVNGRFRPALLVLAAAVGVVMLIVCANLSNLQLARTTSRQKEMAIRVALGAGRRRLIQQMLTESLALSCCGAALGLIAAWAGTRAVAQLDSFSIPLLHSVKVDGLALAFTALLAVVTGIVLGLVPALQAPRLAVHGALKASGRGASDGGSHGRIRAVLVVAEVALACVLLVGAGLLLRSFLRVLEVNPGFRPEHVASIRVDPARAHTGSLEKVVAYYDEVLRRTRETTGVSAAGLTDVLPLTRNRSWGVAGKGQVYTSGNYPEAFVRIVSDGYFGAMGIRIRAGRDFTDRDAPKSERVIIINETLARMLWPGQEPLGQVMTADVERRVIGIVDDIRHQALESGTSSEMYLPIRQTGDYSAVDLVVRTDLPPASLASTVRTVLAPLDPQLPANELRTMQQLVDKALSPRRFLALLLAGFSGFALVLASLGIYAVISYAVGQRTREIGIRMALGASARDLQARIVARTLGLAGLGLVIGLTVSLILGRALSGFLFGVTPADPATFIAMAAVLAFVAAMAGYLPARRAARINPTVALREG